MIVFAPTTPRALISPTSKRSLDKAQQQLLQPVKFKAARVQAQATGAIFQKNRNSFSRTRNERRVCAFAFGGLFGGQKKEVKRMWLLKG